MPPVNTQEVEHKSLKLNQIDKSLPCWYEGCERTPEYLINYKNKKLYSCWCHDYTF